MNRIAAADWMVALDAIGGLIVIYSAVIITHSDNYLTVRGILQFAHKIVLTGIAAALEWHAYDIWTAPQLHGLAGSNFLLHVSVVGGLFISAVRHRLRQRELERARLGYTNGDVLAGPYPHRGRH